MTEEFRQIQKWPGYFACKDGRIGSITKGLFSIKSPVMNTNGYHAISLSIDGKPYCRSVHRLIAETFVTRVEGKDCVNHKNGIQTDNRVENLEWMTNQENLHHARKTLGHSGGKRKLAKNEYFYILIRTASGESQSKIATSYGVHQSTVSNMLRGAP